MPAESPQPANFRASVKDRFRRVATARFPDAGLHGQRGEDQDHQATEPSREVPTRYRCPVRGMGGLWAYRSAHPETSIPGNLNVEQPLNR